MIPKLGDPREVVLYTVYGAVALCLTQLIGAALDAVSMPCALGASGVGRSVRELRRLAETRQPIGPACNSTPLAPPSFPR